MTVKGIQYSADAGFTLTASPVLESCVWKWK